MWILPQSPFFPSAPEEAGLTSALSWPFQLLASSASLNGMASPPASWYRRWKRTPWLQLLYGRICEPSTAARGVDEFIASLPDTLANRSVRPASVVAQTITATCGPKFIEWCRRYVPRSSFWKMSQGTLALGLEESSEISAEQATELRRLSSGLRMWAHRINGNGSLSSAWMTPRLGNGTNEVGNRRVLNEQVKNWATPEAMVMDGTSRRKPDRSPNTRHQESLHHQIHRWPTPMSGSPTEKGGGGQFTTQVEQWATPQAHDEVSPRHTNQIARRGTLTTGGHRNLNDEATVWPTPGVHTNPDASPNSQRKSDLRETVKNWPTATVESGDQTLENPTPGQTGGTTLGGEARSFHQDPATSKPGDESSPTTPVSHRRLNPRFVSWLQGWPLIGGNGSDSLETEWFHYRRRMRSRLLQLVSD